MIKFIERMQEERTPHERRAFAVRAAGAFTAVLFVGWLATLGVGLSLHANAPQVANTAQTPSQSASVGGIIPVEQNGNSLIVASSSTGY